MKVRDIVAIKHFDEYYSRQSSRNLYVCSANRNGQLLRFRVISEVGDLSNKSILDVGCGLGEFYYFCRNNGTIFKKYFGIDLNPKVVKQASEYFPELNILHMDVMENNFNSNKFDYVIASLLFCFETENWDERMQSLIKEMFRISKIGVAMNFLRWRKEGRNSQSHYVKYDNIIKIIECHTNSYTIRANYKKNDFTVYMYKGKL